MTKSLRDVWRKAFLAKGTAQARAQRQNEHVFCKAEPRRGWGWEECEDSIRKLGAEGGRHQLWVLGRIVHSFNKYKLRA